MLEFIQITYVCAVDLAVNLKEVVASNVHVFLNDLAVFILFCPIDNPNFLFDNIELSNVNIATFCYYTASRVYNAVLAKCNLPMQFSFLCNKQFGPGTSTTTCT